MGTPATVEAEAIYFPQFGNGGGLTADIVLLNPATTGDPVTATVELLDPDGNPLDVGFTGGGGTEVSIPPLDAVTLRTDGQGDLMVGSAAVFPDGPMDGVIRFAIPGFGVAGVPSSPPLTGGLAPIRNEGSIRTALAIRNTADFEIDVHLCLWIQTPFQQSLHLEEWITLEVGSRIAQFADEIFEGVPEGDFAGLVRINAEQGSFAAVALEQGPGVFTTLPVSPRQNGQDGSLNGSLDASFDGDGLVTTDFSMGSTDTGRAGALQADGKIIVAGTSNTSGTFDFALARYNSDGSLDTAFDGDGLLTTDFSMGSGDEGFAAAIQSDGKILVAGSSTSNFALARYNPDGSLDTSFDGDGLVITRFGAFSLGLAVTIQSDGKILVAGETLASGSFDFALARYNSDGSLDTSFDGDGLLTTDFSIGSLDLGLAVAVQSDGKILVAGTSDSSGNRDFALARYNSDGSLDTSFDGDGLLTADFSSGLADIGRAVAIQSDGKIIVAGESAASGNFDFALARYNSDGSLDASFDGDGLVTTGFSVGSSEEGYAVAIQSDGKILATGSSGADFALARFKADGSLDTSFDADGVVTTDFTGSGDQGRAIVIQSDGKILVVGRSTSDFALARYNNKICSCLL